MNCENIYHGLVRAFTGGNIGAPSNDITKIWNSGDITDESIKSTKWLVMQVNYIIDYAKTLYKPLTPNDVELTLSQFTKAKVPHFFKYAKKKTDSQIEDANYSVVNRIEFLFPQKKLNYNFSQSNLGRFDYRVLMYNPETQVSGQVFNKYKELTKHIKFNHTVDKQYSDDKSLVNYLAVYDDCREQLIAEGQRCGLTDKETVDRIIYGLFAEKPTANKKAFWMVFGDMVYENVCSNLGDKFVQCDRCRKRFYTINPSEHICEKCQKTLSKKNMTFIICEDCGKRVEMPIANKTNQKRCAACTDSNRVYKKYIWDVVSRG